MPVAITALYAAILGLVLIALSARIAGLRGKTGIGIGHEGSDVLSRAVRVHGNFIEYAPIALILMALIELNGGPALLLHGLGLALVVGRLLHAWGLSGSVGVSFGRAAGTIATWTAIGVGALFALYQFVTV